MEGLLRGWAGGGRALLQGPWLLADHDIGQAPVGRPGGRWAGFGGGKGVSWIEMDDG